MPSAVFRFDASPAIGAGHAMRCIVLADELKARDWDVRLMVTQQTLVSVPALERRGDPVMTLDEANWSAPDVARVSYTGCDVVVVDHYGLDGAYESALRGWAKSTVVIDDLADRPHDCDLLLDQTEGRGHDDYDGLIAPHCKMLMGSRFALLRSEFVKAAPAATAKRLQTKRIEKVLVSFGYTDPANATSAALNALKGRGFDVTVAIGSSAPHLTEVQGLCAEIGATVILDADNMADLMVEADLAIGAAGSTSWERCCLGLPAIAVVTGNDQALVARALDEAGAAMVVAVDGIAQALDDFDMEAWRAMSKAAWSLCDGGGASRVADEIERMLESKGSNRDG